VHIPLTVALLTYNRSHYLREAIEGIRAQTYRNFEFLILDNGSTDDTPSVVLGIQDERIRYVRNPPGLEIMFNGVSAFKIARGRRLIITHDDDIMQPQMLEKQMAIMDANPDVTAVWTNTSTIDQDGNTIQEYFTPPGNDRIYGKGEFIARFPSENLWPLPSCMMFERARYSRRYIDPIYYDQELGKRLPKNHGGDDVLIPALMNTFGSVAFLNAPLLKYRKHGAQDSNRTHLSRGIVNTYKILRRLAGKLADRERIVPLLDSHIARFTAQHEIIHTVAPQPDAKVRAQLKRLFDKACSDLSHNMEAAPPLLPLRIFLSQTLANGRDFFEGLTEPASENPTATHALFHWAKLRQSGGNLFSAIPPKANVVILGSALISALLINEARERGLNLLCCIDSNVTRQNQTMLGTLIRCPEWIATEDKPIDYVILSSERDQDAYLREFMHGLNKTVQIRSWKELAFEDFDASPTEAYRT